MRTAMTATPASMRLSSRCVRSREAAGQAPAQRLINSRHCCFPPQIATSTDRRRTHSLWVTHMFAYSIIIVGIIFLVLTCTGETGP